MLLGVLRNLDTQRFESVVCCIQDRGELADEVEALGIPVVSLGLMQRGGHDRRVVPALRQLMRDHRIDLVHTHLYHANLYGRLATRRENLPVIASVHNTYHRTKWHRRLLNRLLARRTYAVTAGSAEVERDLLTIDRIPRDKVVRLPNCIDLDRVETGLTASEAKRQLGFQESDIVIGTVGRVEEQKGHTYLLEAFAQVRQQPGGDALRLLIVGDGRMLPRLHETAATLGLEEVCRFPGQLAKLADVYRAVDLFAMPSLWEGLSLAMLEAMAAGLPVIATDVGGAREVLGDNQCGRLVPPRDATALARAITDLLGHPDERARVAAAGRDRVRSTYSAVTLAARLSSMYLAALGPAISTLHDKTPTSLPST